MRFQPMKRGVVVLTLALFYPGLTALAQDSKVPITASDEALESYLQGRDLAEKLRATDGRQYYKQAVAADEDFALGYWALAVTSPTAGEFFEAYEMALEKADNASEPERRIILALDAAVKGDPATQEQHLTALIAAYPNDERVNNLLANYYNGRQEYAKAIQHYEQAISINPKYSPPYNSAGYAYRAIGQYEYSERSFQRYIALLPEEPNPYDSYAELLMKLGRYQESVEQFEKALEQDPNFVISYRVIGVNQIFMGDLTKARKTFATFGEKARTDGERRTALTWTAASYVYEGDTDRAIDALETRYDIVKEKEDAAAMSGDHVFMGNVLLEADRTDDAMSQYERSINIILEADVPAEVKAAAARNHHYFQARVALAERNLDAAKQHTGLYDQQVQKHEIPFEMRRVHELTGSIAIAEKNWPEAVSSLEQANHQDPRILYLMAVAYNGAGDQYGGQAMMEKAANFNGLNFNYAYVRAKAMAAMEEE